MLSHVGRVGSSALPVPCNVGAAKGGMQSLSPSHAPLRLGTAVVAGAPELQKQLEEFRDRSRSFVCQPRVDPAGRIMCTMRPEWLSSLSDEEAFQRAALAKKASLSVCFGLPFFVRGRIVAVVLFFDVAQRPYDPRSVDLGDSIAGMLGNAFGARLGKDER